jgi:hypothetical protein
MKTTTRKIDFDDGGNIGYIVESDEYNVFGTGFTVKEAEEDFKHTFNYYYHYYKDDPSRFTGEALKLREKYLKHGKIRD